MPLEILRHVGAELLRVRFRKDTLLVSNARPTLLPGPLSSRSFIVRFRRTQGDNRQPASDPSRRVTIPDHAFGNISYSSNALRFKLTSDEVAPISSPADERDLIRWIYSQDLDEPFAKVRIVHGDRPGARRKTSLFPFSAGANVEDDEITRLLHRASVRRAQQLRLRKGLALPQMGCDCYRCDQREKAAARHTCPVQNPLSHQLAVISLGAPVAMSVPRYSSPAFFHAASPPSMWASGAMPASIARSATLPDRMPEPQ